MRARRHTETTTGPKIHELIFAGYGQKCNCSVEEGAAVMLRFTVIGINFVSIEHATKKVVETSSEKGTYVDDTRVIAQDPGHAKTRAAHLIGRIRLGRAGRGECLL